MNINLSKTINELAPLQIADLIDVEYETVKAVAAASNGFFLTDRDTLPASEFLAKYFADYAVYDTLEKMEARAIAKRAAAIKVTAKVKAKVCTSEILEEYGNYIVSLWESGGEFAASYRKTDHLEAHFHLLSKHEIEYKPDGRRFAVVHHTQSRKEALEKKASLIESYVNRGLIYKGEMPV